MWTYILRRILVIPVLLLGITITVFFLVRMAPGDPVTAQYGIKLHEADPEKIEQLREKLGLNDPLHIQYIRYVSNLVQGDMGTSITSRLPVIEEIGSRFPATLELALAAMVFSVIFSVPLGIIAGLNRGSWNDNLLMGGSLLGVSIPSYWLGIMLMLLFGLTLDWLPVIGRGEGPIWGRLDHLVLPAITLSTGLIGFNSRLMRSAILDVMSKDYIRTARGKGLASKFVIIRHMFPNALIALVTVMGMQFASLLGGAVLIETIFAWPGIGRLAVERVFRRDYPVIMGTVLVFAFTFMISSLVVDVIYSFLDPRIRYD
ncbi:MAG: ABC transporter permease [Anaerolineaceae bacterium]|nr:ABC transporter permease [Anaerolineaceae bacterium]